MNFAPDIFFNKCKAEAKSNTRLHTLQPYDNQEIYLPETDIFFEIMYFSYFLIIFMLAYIPHMLLYVYLTYMT